MRKAITQVKVSGRWEQFLGQDVKPNVQNAKVKELVSSNGDNGKYEAVQIWESDRGIVKMKRFDKPASAPAATAPILPPSDPVTSTEDLTAEEESAIQAEDEAQVDNSPEVKPAPRKRARNK